MRSNLLRAAAAVLATDRLTRLITEDEISRPVREDIARRWPDSRIAYLVTCKACVSVWTGLLVSSGKLPARVVSALALSGAVLFTDRQEDRLGAVVATYRRNRSGG